MKVDVLITGGGLVGGPLAAALAQAGVDVAVIDAEPPAVRLDQAYDGRCSALALAQQRVLAALGLWPAIEPFAAPIRHIRVSDGASPFFLHYDHRALGSAPFGWIVENRAIRLAIQDRLGALPKARLLAPMTIAEIERGKDKVVARLADGRRIEALLLVGSDGRGSKTRAQAGIKVSGWNYGQTAIVCTVIHEKPHHDTAQEHFLPAGPFAILPLTGTKTAPNRSSIVWTEKAGLVPAIMAQDDAGFLRELKSRFGAYLGEIAVEGPRFSYPLSLQLADRYTEARLALVGDAAHGMHPVAGQGMNMGLRDVAALAEIVVEAKRLGLDPGSAMVLAGYARWRRFDNLLMLGLTDVIVRLFSNDIGPVKLVRDLGLAAVDRIAPLKRFFMRHAMGEVGDLPRLMRGELL